ncbi:hypothetical protein SAMN05428989_1284 [Pseudoxanthomonas sp. GM95]|uniref:hypothetical protein n=1 Tax=Pseudoxanthomonas sp. GM95 TaxID=1881043 RepID=UPI0008AD7C46|nr:hypothetical protein [Pseudoxanthomonas sp. GM95]SEL03134.1 hypothetical protein SAMN05428989_1284 [Pseudoxanthomonas sp. GM95]
MSDALICLFALFCGYLFFWIVALHWRTLSRRLNPLSTKYIGMKSYEELRNWVMAANMIWGPIILVATGSLLITHGWGALWMVFFLAGYATAFLRFVRNSKKDWDDRWR